jgi:type IV secretion system protein VirB1
MSALTVQAALALALHCAPGVDPNLMVGIARHESGLDPTATHRNANGTTDYGLLQINSANFGWLSLSVESSLDPCRSMAAGAAILTRLSIYNTGNPTLGMANGYSAAVTASVRAVKNNPSPAPFAPEVVEDRPAITDGETFFLEIKQ